MQNVDLGVMILVHKRPWPLRLIVEQISEAWPNSIIQLTEDRCELDIASILDGTEGAVSQRAPFPVVDENGEHFMVMRQWQLEQIRKYNPKYIGFWDDDHLLEDPDEVKQYMTMGADIIDMKKAFFWDDLEHTNERIPPHVSPVFFKDRPGTSFPDTESRIIHCPVGIHDDPASVRVVTNSRLLDVGYLDAAERARVWAAYKEAGKIDAATMALVEDPQLVKFESEMPAYKQLLNGKK